MSTHVPPRSRGARLPCVSLAQCRSPLPRVYFAGVAQHQHCEWLAGHRVLQSYANMRMLMVRYHSTFKSMALEGGVISTRDIVRREAARS